MATRERDLGWKRIKRELDALGKKSVKVGIQTDAGEGEDSDTPIVEYAYYNEYGTSRIPARPFMRNAFDENRADLNNTVEKLWSGVQSGKIDAAMAARTLGEHHQGQIDESIVKLDRPPNAPSTIDRKGSSNPLIDNDAMRQAIRYVVED